MNTASLERESKRRSFEEEQCVDLFEIPKKFQSEQIKSGWKEV